MITLYNEPGEQLALSLLALTKSIQWSQAKNAATQNNAKQILPHTICIIADGYHNLSDSTKAVFKHLGKDLERDELSTSDMLIHNTSINTAELIQSLEGINFHQTSLHKNTAVKLLLCIKRENSGKLDTHWWYYRLLCPTIEPQFCFHLDTATEPCLESIYHMEKCMLDNSEVGAVASSVCIKPLENVIEILNIWQYRSLLNSVYLEWPTDELLSYLNVIPGQYGVMRWEAIADDKERDDVQREGLQPLDIYFKGLGKLPPFESSLYLAEDRVLCKEVILRPKHSWKLKHVDHAIAYSDACENLPELLQRKRP